MRPRPLIVASLLALLGATAIAEPPPEVKPAPDAERLTLFRDLSPKAALKLAMKEEKILLIKWTATWCGPCKQMDRDTWPHPDVRAWVDANAIAIEADLDRMQKGAKLHRINAIPAIVAFKGTEELDRVVGYRSAKQMLGWFVRLENGEERPQADRRRHEPVLPATSDSEAAARFTHAEELFRDECFVRAADEYFWLWVHFRDDYLRPETYRVRNHAESEFVCAIESRLQDLATWRPDAAARIRAFRDSYQIRFELVPSIDPDAFRDWYFMNIAFLGDRDSIVAWAERTARKKMRFGLPERSRQALRRRLFEANRWDLAAAFLADPMAEVERARFIAQDVESILGDPENRGDRSDRQWERMCKEMRSLRIDDFAEIHIMMLAQGRIDIARTVLDITLEYDASDATRNQLATAALGAGYPHAMHLDLIDGAEQPNTFIRKKIERALAEKKE